MAFGGTDIPSSGDQRQMAESRPMPWNAPQTRTALTAAYWSSKPASHLDTVAKSSASQAQDDLMNFASKWSLSAPVYTVIASALSQSSARTRRSGNEPVKEFYAKVVIGDNKFLTHPQTARSENGARELVATKALKNMTEERTEKFPSQSTPRQNNFLIAQILSIVKDDPQGLLDHHIEEEYLKRFDAFPPADWLQIVRSTDSQLEVQEANHNRKLTIISLKPPPTIDQQQGWIVDGHEAGQQPERQPKRLPKMLDKKENVINQMPKGKSSAVQLTDTSAEEKDGDVAAMLIDLRV